MTPKISLVTVAAVALVAVPAAMGQSQTPDVFERAAAAHQRSTPLVSPDAVDRARAAQLALQSNPIVSPDAIDRMKALRLPTSSSQVTSPDVVERAAAMNADYGNRIVFDDRFNEPANVPVASSSTGSGRELEWSQIGIGFGLGIALALGLFLAMRYTRIRPLAH
ncbi:MAG: hypothetical protein H0T97_02200 [Actinobacteria bacterium]|nr:hypothetical protein [Actinomycetota bacterium]